ncbi:hypothetical protein B0A48_08756 [Cryoendolithus antarcticus]|uniref:Major facilitator superfamily (MFS) profile domain-containing protein n=1 Tax=Cryoendolithus antarcticus TaxID=1507870 RepID=A0A1V8T4N3_9PEZI|nr:hypothetical protein B0A48_08756 [Cryoendolithus antarcticus]
MFSARWPAATYHCTQDVEEERSRHVRSTQLEWDLQDMTETNKDTARREEGEYEYGTWRSSKSGLSRHIVGQEELRAARMTTVVIALVLTLQCSLDMTIVATTIPSITSQFKTVEDVGWYGSAFLLTVSTSQATWGQAYKHFDLKSAFLISIAIFEIGSLICGLARSSIALIIGRAVTGLGAAGVVSGAYSIVAFSVVPHKRPAYMGILGATYAFASVFGPVLGGLFADKISWRWCFWINLPVGAAAVFLIALTFSTPTAQALDPARKRSLLTKLSHMDIPGLVTLSASIVALLLALQWGGVSRPTGAALFVLVYIIPPYFQFVQGCSAVTSAIRNLALIIPLSKFSPQLNVMSHLMISPLAFSTMFCGAVMTLTGHFAILLVLDSLTGTIGCGLIYTLGVDSTATAWVGSQILAGIGLGMCFQTPVMAAQALAPQEDLATTSAIMIFFQTMGGAIFVSAAQSSFSNSIISSVVLRKDAGLSFKALTLGATQLKGMLSTEEMSSVIAAYMDGLSTTFVMALVLAACSILVSPLSPWINVKGKCP